MTAITDLSPALLEQLAAWLPQQRWFAAKGRHISSVAVATSVVLREAATPDGPRGDRL
jgi:hypothetical protein